MNQNLDRLLAGLAERGERVVELQSALTACKALGPDNGGRGELDKVRRITDWLTACGVRDLRRMDAPDNRVPDGLRPIRAASKDAQDFAHIVMRRDAHALRR